METVGGLNIECFATADEKGNFIKMISVSAISL